MGSNRIVQFAASTSIPSSATAVAIKSIYSPLLDNILKMKNEGYERRNKETRGNGGGLTTRELSISCCTLSRSNTQPRCDLTSGSAVTYMHAVRRSASAESVGVQYRRCLRMCDVSFCCTKIILGPVLLQCGAQHINDTREPTHVRCSWSCWSYFTACC